jgi:alkylated DNA nucleotide flippase Atl1
VTYAALARIAGVLPAYCRAMPTVLRSPAARGLPVHRVVPASPDKLGPVQRRALEDEGVELADLAGRADLAGLAAPGVPSDLDDIHWDGATYYAAQEVRVLHQRIR